MSALGLIASQTALRGVRALLAVLFVVTVGSAAAQNVGQPPAGARPAPSFDPPGRSSSPSAQPATGMPGPRFSEESRRLIGPVPYTEEVPAPALPPDVVDDKRRKRSYPDQPPVIPHSIRDYQIDRNSNKCLTCHSRQFTEQSQAPMISVTHYMDRDGNMLAAVSPRRYFCTACHVPQTTAEALVPNGFVDVDTMLQPPQGARGR